MRQDVVIISPGPLSFSGVGFYSYKIAKVLSKTYKVYFICENKNQVNDDHKNELNFVFQGTPEADHLLSCSNSINIFQMANNPAHNFVIEAHRKHRGILEIHDGNCHHLLLGNMSSAKYTHNKKSSYRSKIESVPSPVWLQWVAGVQTIRYPFTVQEIKWLSLKDQASQLIVHTSFNKYMYANKFSCNINVIPHIASNHFYSENDSKQEFLRKKFDFRKKELKHPERLTIGLFGGKNGHKGEGELLCFLQELDFKVNLIIAGSDKINFLQNVQKIGKDHLIDIYDYGVPSNEKFEQLFLALDLYFALRKYKVGEVSGPLMTALSLGIYCVTEETDALGAIEASGLSKLNGSVNRAPSFLKLARQLDRAGSTERMNKSFYCAGKNHFLFGEKAILGKYQGVLENEN